MGTTNPQLTALVAEKRVCPLSKKVWARFTRLWQQHYFIGSIGIVDHSQTVWHANPCQARNVLMLDIPNDV